MEEITIHNYEAFLLDHLEGRLDEASLARLKAFALMHPELEIDLENTSLPVVVQDEMPLDFKEQLKKTEADLRAEALLNYLEGFLPEEERKVLELKLLNDKNLAAELELFKKTHLSLDVSETIQNKTGFYKTEEDALLNNRALAYVENILGQEERSAVETELKTNAGLQKEVAGFSKTKLSANAALIYPNKAELKKAGRVVALFGFRNVAAMAAAILLLLGFVAVINYYTHSVTGINTTPGLAKKALPVKKKKMAEPLPSVDQASGSSRLATKTQVTTAPSLTRSIAPIRKSAVPALSQQNEEQNPVAENKERKAADSQPAKPLQEDVENTLAVSTLSANNQASAQTDSLPLAYSATKPVVVLTEERDDEPVAASAKKGFWSSAVKLARRANSLGLKAVDGEESANHNYSLSFNSFSVQKH